MGNRYSIKKWSEVFLTEKTRDRRGRLKSVQMPVKLDDVDYIGIASKKDGAQHLGVWLALVEVAGGLEARDGRLCRSDGTPLSTHELSLLTRLPMAAIEGSLRALSEAGWLISEPFGTIPNDSETPPLSLGESSLDQSRKVTSSGDDLVALAVWNDNCAPLPTARVAKGTRRSRWREFRKEAGDFSADAVRAAAADSFYREKSYGIDTFLRHWQRWLDVARNGIPRRGPFANVPLLKHDEERVG